LLAPIFHIFAVNQTEDISKPFKLILNGGFYLTVGLFSLTIVSLMLLIKPNSEMPLYITRLTDFTTPLLMLGIIGYRNRLVHKELDEVKRALNEATIRAEYEKKLLTDRQTLIDMFAHELKNPLTSISLAVDNLADNSEPNASSSRKRIANINRSIKDMDEIIERCNLMNTLDSKSIALEKNQVFLRKFVRQILVSLEAQDIVVVDITPDIELSTDAKFLRVIFTNLIQNALKYSVPNSKITIMARETSPNVSIEFTNELNVSMLPDELLIFTRFYRHPLAHEKRGAGLGLYLTKEMCKLLGGYISYNHENGVVIFSVEIPSL
jgi:signal transduction histidine kinase